MSVNLSLPRQSQSCHFNTGLIIGNAFIESMLSALLKLQLFDYFISLFICTFFSLMHMSEHICRCYMSVYCLKKKEKLNKILEENKTKQKKNNNNFIPNDRQKNPEDSKADANKINSNDL